MGLVNIFFRCELQILFDTYRNRGMLCEFEDSVTKFKLQFLIKEIQELKYAHKCKSLTQTEEKI